MKKDKVKVIDEVLNEDRIKQFLFLEAPDGENPDFHRLQKAYRGLPAHYFETFLHFFVDAGGDVNALSHTGKTIFQTVNEHTQSDHYRDILASFGAQ